MHIMIKFFSILFLLFCIGIIFSESAFAQRNSVSGRAVDSVSERGIGGVTIVAYSPTEKYLAATSTDSSGSFELKNIKQDSVSIRFSMIGYQPVRIDTVISGSLLAIGAIKMGTSSMVTNEIVVKGFKPMIEYYVDKKVINMDRIPGGTGMVTDALASTGAVEVDPISKKITIRGQSVKILIDGRPAPGAEDMLQQMPAETFEKVEVSTGTSAREDPEGEGATVNFITKGGFGENLSASAMIGSSTANLNFGFGRMTYKTDLYSVYGMAMGGLGEFGSNSSNQRITFNNPMNYKELYSGKNLFKGNQQMIRLGFDYDPNPANSFSVTGNYTRLKFDSHDDRAGIIYKKDDSFLYNSISSDTGDNLNQEYRFTGYYKRKFDAAGHELSLDLFYLNYDRGADNDLYTYMDYLNGYPARQNSSYDTKNNTFIAKLDYVNPLAFGKIEAGYHFTLRDRENDYNTLNYSYTADLWKDSLGLSNLFKYKEYINALYIMYSDNIGSFGYKAGLRGEIADNNGDLQTRGITFNSSYTDLYPSLNLFYKLNQMLQVNLNFGRKVNRPQMDYINPFRKRLSHNRYSQGNPSLDPTYTNLAEFQISQLLNVYYSKSTGNPRSVDSYENDSVVVNSYINLSSIRTYGFDVTIPYYPAAMPFKLWDWIDMMFVKYSWYNVRQEGQYLKENLTTDKSVWSLTANGVFTIWDDLKLMAYLRYTPKQSDQRVTTYASTDLTLSLNKNFYDSKLRLSLIIQNALNTSRYQGETRGSNYFNAYSTLQLHPRSIMLTLTYIFNNYKEKTERKVDDGRDKSNEGLF